MMPAGACPGRHHVHISKGGGASCHMAISDLSMTNVIISVANPLQPLYSSSARVWCMRPAEGLVQSNFAIDILA